jgi:hypothetical protein
MPRSPAPQWKLRKQPIVDHLVQASIDAVGGICDPDTGHFGRLVYAGCESAERAQEIHQALFRCAYYMHTHKIADVSMSAKVKPQKDGTYNVEYVAINKAHARMYQVNTKGQDRNKWAYNPRARGSK